MKVKVVRIYLTEGKHTHREIFERLHNEHKVMGVTIFRGISGFGKSGHMHSSALLDLSLNLPLVIEFFDEEEKINAALESIRDVLEPGNVLTFDAILS